MTDHINCRLCGSSAQRQFQLNVIGKHDVAYFRCDGCGALQTEAPYWLDEAYSLKLPNLDTGAAQRNIDSQAVVYAIARLFGGRNILDIGGKDGLLCRLMRDLEFNCYTTDKYAEATYAEGFTVPDFDRPDLVIAFEVLEHFADPKADLDALFEKRPDVLLVTTGIYTDEKADWWYIAPEAGQHVFFYSPKALAIIAERYGYRLVVQNWFILFIKSEAYSDRKARLAKWLLTPGMRQIVRAFVAFKRATGHQTDHLRQKAKMHADSSGA
jgi:2-polyprenyl-3-methyl-5-hydroxy-6-metoxy-1,4-benzoquinol methylase